MRLLFSLDTHDYNPAGSVSTRPSVRGIIIMGDRVALVYSRKYDYYKFPGGGIEAGESHVEALVREVREEIGLVVRPGSIREYGYVHRAQRGKREDVFIQDNYYYFCKVEAETTETELEAYEAEEGFTLVITEPEKAIAANRGRAKSEKPAIMLEREARVLELLLQEGYVG